MITHFNTASAGSSASSSAASGSRSGGNTILYVAGAALLAWGLWEFWWKPSQAKKKEQETK